MYSIDYIIEHIRDVSPENWNKGYSLLRLWCMQCWTFGLCYQRLCRL